METILTILATPLGWVLYWAFRVTENFGISVIIFSVIAKLLLFPVTRLAHLNSIRLLKLQPTLSAIQKRYTHDKNRLNEERYELFQREKYNPLVGLVPILVQLILLMGMLQVMYDPLFHMGLADRGSDAVGFDLTFLGVNLGVVPSFANPSIELIMPVLSGVAALVFSLVQNSLSPGALSQGSKTNTGLIIFTVALSIYFALVTPAGVGLYWTVGNLFAIVTVLVLNMLYNPRKLAAEALALKESERKTPAELSAEKQKNKELKSREKADGIKFASAKKQLVFYAISGGQYKYYVEVIEYIIKNSDITIHYLTNDPNDDLFINAPKQVIPYYVGHVKTIKLMMQLNADMVVTTVPDLHNFHLKRSIVRDDIEYVYIFHGFTSPIMVMRPGTLDHYDTVFCVGQHHVTELRRAEELYGTKKKRLVKAGYAMFDRLLARHENSADLKNEKPQILIAPSWQSDNIMDLCLHDTLGQLLGQGYKIIIRPHPDYIRYHNENISVLKKQYANVIESGELSFETDFKESSSLYLSDIVITDWSNAAYEFSFCTKRPIVFINTPMKVLNPNYKDFDIVPSDIFLRDKVGVSIDVKDIGTLGNTIENILENREMYKEKITTTVDEFMFYPRRSGEAGGAYILKQLQQYTTKEESQ